MPTRRTRTNLKGTWKLKLGETTLRDITVPSSYTAMGTVTLSRELPPVERSANDTVYLVFDGIANRAKIEIGSAEVGWMLPFVPYRFPVTPLLRQDEPVELEVTIQDVDAPFGYSRGWETYGGIIRDVYLEKVGPLHLGSVHFRPRLTSDYAAAACEVHVEISNLTAKEIRANLHGSLTRQGGPAGTGTTFERSIAVPPTYGQPFGAAIRLREDSVALWSPDNPDLYRLEIGIRSPSNDYADELALTTGFRSFEIRGRRFFLNGRPIFLKGVCRHDTWKDQGYTLSRNQMEDDMRAIKELGANFVRLVHYPHHRYIVELADRIGLMVTEEPGLWNLDLRGGKNKVAKQSALEVAEKLVKRDRNSPSVIGWLLGNECQPDRAFFRKGYRLCKALDAERPVSFSHIYAPDLQSAKKAYAKAGFDFYDYHPYTHTTRTFDEVTDAFPDKPLIFGEWGGWWCRDNERLMKQFGRAFKKHADFAEEDSRHLNGIAYWEWADMRQYGRGGPACEDGVLTEGLVAEDRTKKNDYYVMKEVFAWFDGKRESREVVSVLDVGSLSRRPNGDRSTAGRPKKGEFVCLDLGPASRSEAQMRAWEAIAQDYSLAGSFTVGGIPFELPGSGESASGPLRPLVLTPEIEEMRIAVDMPVYAVHFLGHAAVNGFPLFGELGQEVAELVFGFEDGTTSAIRLQNGIHIARMNTLYQGSRLDPVAPEAPVALKVVRDPDFAVHHIRYFCHEPAEARAGVVMKHIVFKAVPRLAFLPLLYAVTVETQNG